MEATKTSPIEKLEAPGFFERSSDWLGLVSVLELVAVDCSMV